MERPAGAGNGRVVAWVPSASSRDAARCNTSCGEKFASQQAGISFRVRRGHRAAGVVKISRRLGPIGHFAKKSTV